MKKERLIALILGCTILVLFVLMSAFPSVFTHYGQKEMFDSWLSPSAAHPLGTNDMGYDIFTELVYGSGQTLLIGIASSLIAMLLGTVIGILAAMNNFAGHVFNGIINVFMLLPKLVCLIVVAAFLGRSQIATILLIAAFGWVGTARAVRARTLKIKNSVFIENCVIQGYSKVHIAMRHVLPNLYDVLFSRMVSSVSGCVMMESSLSFLGIGDLYNPTWGTMINLAFRRGAFIRRAYNWLLVPGAAISLLVLAFWLIGLAVKKREA